MSKEVLKQALAPLASISSRPVNSSLLKVSPSSFVSKSLSYLPAYAKAMAGRLFTKGSPSTGPDSFGMAIKSLTQDERVHQSTVGTLVL